MLLKTEQTFIADKKFRYFTLGNPSNEMLVLLHGYPDNLQIWYKIAPLLAEKYFVFGFDWPGMGYSEEWAGGATPVAMAKRLKEIFAHFNFKQAHLFSHDMGGQAALVFAALFPEQTKSVSVLNSLLMWSEKTSWEINLLRKFKFNQLVINHLPGIVFHRALNTFIHNTSSIDDAVKKDMWQAFQDKKVRRYIVRMCAGYQAQLKKLPDYYEKITCPVNLIWGEKGKHFSIGHAQALKKICGRAKIHSIEAGCHWMVLDKQVEISQILLKSV